MSELVLGPLLRYVDDRSASVWVETEDRPRSRWWRVTTRRGRRRSPCTTTTTPSSASTTSSRARSTPYRVEVDGAQVWPPADSTVPAVDDRRRSTRASRCGWRSGSCRTSVSHDEEGNNTHGVDALRAYALRMAGVTDPGRRRPGPGRRGALARPGAVPRRPGVRRRDHRGDAGVHRVAARHRPAAGKELKDYEEYAHLYQLAWTDPANRWLLSTVPTAMIFDDHDIRDDWNTSQEWKDEMEATSGGTGASSPAWRRTGSTSTSAT